MAKDRKMKFAKHHRDSSKRYNIKHGAFRFPHNTVDISLNPYRQGQNVPGSEHIFCAHCGREITYYHMERQRTIFLDRQARVVTADGEIFYYCLPYERCMRDRKVSVISKRLNLNTEHYTGKRREHYEFSDLW